MSTISSSPAEPVEVDRAGAELALVKQDPIRVLIADPEPFVRVELMGMLEAGRDTSLVGVAVCVEEAVALASELRPDVALLAPDLPLEGGLEAARRIHADPDSAVNVMMLARHDGGEDRLASARAGVRGYVDRSGDPAQLLDAVRVAAGGTTPLRRG
jgi:DNA-binding NarL/FixJ family response regulator